MQKEKREDIIVAIPARIGSSRLPEKPLVKILGKPLILHVVERLYPIHGIHMVVLTDDERIKATVEKTGVDVHLVKGEFKSGTERIAAFVKDKPQWDTIINVQADEALIRRDVVLKAVEIMNENPHLKYLTFGTEFESERDWRSPSSVKVVTDRYGWALYFSRAPIPYAQKKPLSRSPWKLALKHLGVYCYRRDALLEYVKAREGGLEALEMLEQLRILEFGGKIKVEMVRGPFHSVDTWEDVKIVEQLLKKENAE